MSQLAMGGSYVVETPLGGFGIDEELAGKYVSDPSQVVEVTPMTDDWWIKDPDNLETSLKVYLSGDEFEIDYEEDTYIYRPIGRSMPVVEKGKARGRRASITFDILGDEDYRKLKDLMSKQKALVLVSPIGWQMYFMFDESKNESVVNVRDRYRLIETDIIEVDHDYASL